MLIWLAGTLFIFNFFGAALGPGGKALLLFQGRTIHVVVVKWLLVFTLHCLWTRSRGTKRLLSFTTVSFTDRFFLFNQRVKMRDTGKEKKKNWKKGKVVGGG